MGVAKVLLHLVGDLFVAKSDLMQDISAFKSAAHIYISTDWVASQVAGFPRSGPHRFCRTMVRTLRFVATCVFGLALAQARQEQYARS